MADAITARRTPVRVVLGGCALAVVAACLGDPPPDPETAPLEVVLDGCVLNRHEVAAGAHDVSLIGTGRLFVTDESGEQVLALPDDATELVTTAQTYTFTCTVGSDETSTTLESVSAPGE